MVDHSRLEACEVAVWADFYGAAPRELAVRSRMGARHLGGGLALVVPSVDVLAFNRVLGVGLSTVPTPGDVTEMISVYQKAGVPRFFAQLSPGDHQDEAAAVLAAGGFRYYNNWVRLYRSLDDIPDGTADVIARRIEPELADEFGAVVSDAFGWPHEAAQIFGHVVGRDGWRHYVIMDEGRVRATAAYYVWESYAWFDFAATDRGFRRRGAQQALLVKRMEDARAEGCTGVVVEAAEPAPNKDTPSYRNLIRLGFEELYRRPNHIFEFEQS